MSAEDQRDTDQRATHQPNIFEKYQQFTLKRNQKLNKLVNRD
jgi:hypothetical protein